MWFDTGLLWTSGTECSPQYSNDTCTEERLLAGNWNVCTGEAEGLSCYP